MFIERVYEFGVLFAPVIEILIKAVTLLELFNAHFGHIIKGSVVPPVNELISLHVFRELLGSFGVSNLSLFFLSLFLLLTFLVHHRGLCFCSSLLLQSLFVKFIINFSFGVLESYDIVLVLNSDEGFFEPPPVLLNFPLLFNV